VQTLAGAQQAQAQQVQALLQPSAEQVALVPTVAQDQAQQVQALADVQQVQGAQLQVLQETQRVQAELVRCVLAVAQDQAQQVQTLALAQGAQGAQGAQAEQVQVIQEVQAALAELVGQVLTVAQDHAQQVQALAGAQGAEAEQVQVLQESRGVQAPAEAQQARAEQAGQVLAVAQDRVEQVQALAGVEFESVLASRPGLAAELAELEQAVVRADPPAAMIDNLQARLAQLREVDAVSIAPRDAQILEVSADSTAPNHYLKVASTVPGPPVVLEFPDGSRVWRDAVGGPIRHEATLGEPIGRAGMERGMYSATEHGNLPPGPNYQRAHSLGQGTGFESPYGVFYAPERVNQTLQNHGIESYLHDLAASSQPGETFRVVTRTTPHPFTLRLAAMDYSIIRVAGGSAAEVATYSIRVTASKEHPLVTAGPIRFNPTATAQAVAGRLPLPGVLTKPFSFAC
jgi:hypothetical protein